MDKKAVKRILIDILHDIAGSFCLAVALDCFSAPANIAPGGVSGIAVLVNHLLRVSIGTVNMALNIPLLVLAWFMLGHLFTLRTLRTVAIMTVIMNFIDPMLPVYQGDAILAALFGGVLSGAALGIVFMRGSTTGGGDIISRLLQKKFRFLPVGQAMFLIDMGVLLASMVVFRSIESGLYGLISIYTTERVLDGILYGLGNGKMVLIITEFPNEIAKRIMDELERGITYLHGSGGYLESPKKIVMSIVRPSQLYKVESIVRQIDPRAFVISMEANEVQGEGFRSLTQEKLS